MKTVQFESSVTIRMKDGFIVYEDNKIKMVKWCDNTKHYCIASESVIKNGVIYEES